MLHSSSHHSHSGDSRTHGAHQGHHSNYVDTRFFRRKRPSEMSDTVFGLVISLLGFAVVIDNAQDFTQMLRDFGGLALAYAIMILIWLFHHQLLNSMSTEPTAFSQANFVFLFIMICYTYILRMVFLNRGTSYAEGSYILFCIATSLNAIAMAGLYHLAIFKHALIPSSLPFIQRVRREFLVITIICLAGIPLAWLSVALGLALTLFYLIARLIWWAIASLWLNVDLPEQEHDSHVAPHHT